MPNEAITLNAQASLFADTFRWSLISPPVGGAIISSPNSMRTDFSADIDGIYMLRLTARSSVDGTQKSDDIQIVVNSGLTYAPRALTFYTDIDLFLMSNCISCHQNFFEAENVVWWVPDADQPAGNMTGIPGSPADRPSLGLYEQIMARVNPAFIEDSRLLKKPSGQHHYGGLVGNMDTSLPVGDMGMGRDDYDMLVNWIAEGAPCGGNANQCP
jgi:hypothetical protein